MSDIVQHVSTKCRRIPKTIDGTMVLLFSVQYSLFMGSKLFSDCTFDIEVKDFLQKHPTEAL